MKYGVSKNETRKARRETRRSEKLKLRKIAEKIGTDNLYVCEAKLNCGCCYTGPMYFESRESAEAAFSKFSTRMGAKIADDLGNVFEGIDGFYGYWDYGAEPHNLMYLAKKAGFVR